ncbi:unnamed protein product [Phyllotreta striolata]|uniref:Major facilitator superfamily (MFS) profile domain-containing protein n=1 Tax=Phyllotreta striolata TaxID=444603 RepID=A0A9N9TQU1_PHYSR|nr:unnamed protein product [Phyllotreta striolata]
MRSLGHFFQMHILGNNQDENNKENTVKTQSDSENANFEEAITATGYGKFNILLLLFMIPSSFTQASEQMAISYILPIADCDLHLTLEQKSLLNAVSFAGSLSSGVLFGYLSDTFGRKRLIVYGYFLHFVFSLAAATSTNLLQLLIAKFFCGFLFNGPFSSLAAYLTEFHSAQYRSKVQLFRGITFALGFFLVPCLAWIVLPLNINFNLFGLTFHTWNIFLLCCAFPPLMASVLFSFMPESPKFLMSVGKNEEALQVFQKVFSSNCGKLKNDFPIKHLANEKIHCKNEDKKRSVITVIKTSLSKIFAVFKPPHVCQLLLAISVTIGFMVGLCVLKLWLPQILKLIHEDQEVNNTTDINICTVIDNLKNNDARIKETCDTKQLNDNTFIYTSSMIINGVEMFFFMISGFLVNCLGKKTLMMISCVFASLSALGLYFVPNVPVLIALFSIYITGLELTGILDITISLEMFPTDVRTIALSFRYMAARLGAILANLLFPALVSGGCLTPFLFCTLLVGALPFMIHFYPNTENKNLQ